MEVRLRIRTLLFSFNSLSVCEIQSLEDLPSISWSLSLNNIPPKSLFESAKRTFSPFLEAARAAIKPEGPPPTMSKST